ncbi:MAG: hypothetical protein U1E87_08660 [Alphaproteobacteria bacterium]
MSLPHFESEFLAEVEFALRKRSKALKYKTFGLRCERVLDSTEASRQEKFELTLDGPPATRGAWLRLFVWSDRWVWVDARELGKTGWKWECTLEGKLLGRFGGRDLIEAAENSYTHCPFCTSTESVEDVKAIWQSMLATGPKLVT